MDDLLLPSSFPIFMPSKTRGFRSSSLNNEKEKRTSLTSPNSGKLKRTVAIRMLKTTGNIKEQRSSHFNKGISLKRSTSLDTGKQSIRDSINSKRRVTPLRNSQSFIDVYDSHLPALSFANKHPQSAVIQRSMPKMSLRRKKGLVVNRRASGITSRDNTRKENQAVDWKSLADSYDAYHSDSESSKGSIKSIKVQNTTNESNNRSSLTPRRSRSFNVTTRRLSKNMVSLSRTLSTREQDRTYTEKTGIWSKRFLTDPEPSTERISGILKSWTTNTVTPAYVEMNTETDSEDMFVTESSRSLIRKCKHLKPHVGKIMVRYPRSKTIDNHGDIDEPAAIQMVENQGLFPPGKEIKANKVQLNIRTSMEMKLTKEKLCKVILEDVNRSTIEKSSEAPMNETDPRGSIIELCEEPVDATSLFTSATIKASHQVESANCLPVDLEESLQSPHSLSDVGPSFFLAAFSDRLNLPLLSSRSTRILQNSASDLSTKEKSSIETFTTVGSEPEFTPKLDRDLKSTPLPEPRCTSHRSIATINVLEKSESKSINKNPTLDIHRGKHIQRGFLGNLRVESNIKITTSVTLKAYPNSNKINPIKGGKKRGLKSQGNCTQLVAKQQKPTSISDTTNNTIFPLEPIAQIGNKPSKSREIILYGFAYQIINSSAVKHRYLFLFDDLLVITKPLSKEGNRHLGLHSRFLVKHCILADLIHFNGTRERAIKRNDNELKKREREPHPIFTNAVRKFESNPYSGVMYMIDKATLKTDPKSIAAFLHKTPELSKKQLGKFLGMECNHAILNAFLDKCKLSGLRIDDALRVFLASFRLPGEGTIIDYLISAFAKRWYKANRSRISFDADTSIRLSFYMMALNADLHNKKRTLRNKLELQEFLTKFRDSSCSQVNVAEDLLKEIYTSIRRDKLETAVDEAATTHSVLISCPDVQHLEVNESLELMVEIPMPDKNFRIKPVGDGLICEPRILDFTLGKHQTLKFSFTSAGRKRLTLIKLGSRARKYTNLPGRVFMLEPNYMKHSILLTFPAEKSDKKFLFGFVDQATRERWSKSFFTIKQAEVKTDNKTTINPRTVQEFTTWTGYDLLECLTENSKH